MMNRASVLQPLFSALDAELDRAVWMPMLYDDALLRQWVQGRSPGLVGLVEQLLEGRARLTDPDRPLRPPETIAVSEVPGDRKLYPADREPAEDWSSGASRILHKKLGQISRLHGRPGAAHLLFWNFCWLTWERTPDQLPSGLRLRALQTFRAWFQWSARRAELDAGAGVSADSPN